MAEFKEPRIDVHLLTLDERDDWRAACIASLADAPIRLHVLPGLRDRLGEARAAGFRAGVLPLVSFVDPDDTYNPHAFAALADALDADTMLGMVYGHEVRTDAEGMQIGLNDACYSRADHAIKPQHVHGLMVFRRAAVLPHLHLLDGDPVPEWTLSRLVAAARGISRVPVVSRYWRQHPDQYHRTL